MTRVLDLRDGLQHALEESGERGCAELCCALQELLTSHSGARVVSVQWLKARVFRIDIAPGAPWRSVICKRLDPAVAQRTRLVAERWLPALGLSDHCPRLLASAAERRGECVWHVHEDLGDDTLAARLTPDRVSATVSLIADLHTRAANHAVLPDIRRYTGNLGLQYFTANLCDAIAALESLADSDVATPPEYTGLPDRLQDRLVALLADAPRRAQVFAQAAGPDTLLHADLWTINIFVSDGADGLLARLVDWDRVGVGPFSYDLSTFLFRFPPVERPAIVDLYRNAVARAGWRLASPPELQLLFDTAERARYANRVIWPVQALLQEHAAWAFPELAEVERWFCELDSTSPLAGVRS